MPAPPAPRPSERLPRSSSSPWRGRTCTPARPARPRRTGGRSTCTAKQPTPLAGPGAPWVAEFAPADLGAALGISLDAARSLVGDALELAHRLPRLWDLVRELRVPAWRARVIARETRDLSVDAALFADRLIAATPDRVGLVNAARLVQEARLWFDPDRAIADEEAALAKRGVWLRHGATPATTEISMILDTPDAELFDASVRRIAHDLHELGDTDPLDLRRARAVGVLADPQYALDLMSGREGAAPTQNGGAANLYLHLTPADLAPEDRRRHHRASRRRHHPAAHRLAGPVHQHRRQGPGPPGPGPRRHGGRGPARPTRDDARTGPPHRRALRLPRLRPRLPSLRPGPHHRVPPDGGRRTTGPDHRREPRAVVPHPPPDQDPHRLDLQTRPRRLHLDLAHRTPVRRPHQPAPPTRHAPKS